MEPGGISRLFAKEPMRRSLPGSALGVKLIEWSLTRFAHHLQFGDLNIAGFFFSVLLAFVSFVLVLLVTFCLESPSTRHLVANMVAQFYGGAAQSVDLSVVPDETEFIRFVSLLQAAGHRLAATCLPAFLCVGRKRKCAGREREAGDRGKNDISFHG